MRAQVSVQQQALSQITAFREGYVLKKTRFAHKTNIKCLAVLLLLFFVTLFLPDDSFAEYKDTIVIRIGSPYMTVNGMEKEIDPGRGTVSVLDSGRTLVPVRAVAEEMGADVEWDPKDARVDIVLDDIHIKLWINQTLALVNEKVQILDVAPKMVNFRTLVPIRFIAENMGAAVTYDGKTREAVIRYNKKPVPVPQKPSFRIPDRFDELKGNKGRVMFELDKSVEIGKYTGFKVYFTNDRGQKDSVLIEAAGGNEGFYCIETTGKTVEISVTAVYKTAESEPQEYKFAMLKQAEFDGIWSEKRYYAANAPCWFGVSWLPVPGASGYRVYISKSRSDWENFKASGNLEGFYEISVSNTHISTKEYLNLPQELKDAYLGEYRYIVVYPVNSDGVPGLLPASCEIPISGETIKAAN